MPKANTKSTANKGINPSSSSGKNGKDGAKPTSTKAVDSTNSSVADMVNVAVVDRPIRYPEITVNGIKIPRDKLRIPVEKARTILGWETEADYYNRMREKNPKITKQECDYGDTFLLKDETGVKVNCWNNCGNRPFTESWARSLAQDILNRHWRANLEDIIVSKTGQVISGQHRLIALVLASQMWQGKDKEHWQSLWDKEPYIEALIAFGADEDPDTLSTLDQTRPRTLSDIFYTSTSFSWLAKVDNEGKRECSRMLEIAVKTLWKRTQHKGTYRDTYEKYLTSSTSKEFLDAHPKIMDCLHHIYDCNKDRVLSKMRLSPGMCTTALYLMGSCSSNWEDYYNAEQSNEKLLVWDDWGTACQFWSDIATKKAKVASVQEAIGYLFDADDDGAGTGGRENEKMIVLAKAWAAYRDNVAFTTEDLEPERVKDEDGVLQLVDTSVFGGIDNGDGKKRFEPVSQEEKEEQQRKERERSRQKFQDKLRKANEQRRDKKEGFGKVGNDEEESE